jgi:hypothetical protein
VFCVYDPNGTWDTAETYNEGNLKMKAAWLPNGALGREYEKSRKQSFVTVWSHTFIATWSVYQNHCFQSLGHALKNAT